MTCANAIMKLAAEIAKRIKELDEMTQALALLAAYAAADPAPRARFLAEKGQENGGGSAKP